MQGFSPRKCKTCSVTNRVTEQVQYLMGTEIGVNVAQIVENPGELIVPTITLYEVYKKLLAEKN